MVAEKYSLPKELTKSHAQEINTKATWFADVPRLNGITTIAECGIMVQKSESILTKLQACPLTAQIRNVTTDTQPQSKFCLLIRLAITSKSINKEAECTADMIGNTFTLNDQKRNP